MTHSLNYDGQTELTALPAGLTCYELSAKRTGLRELPPITAQYRIDLSNCHDLTTLPPDLRVSTLIVQNCTRLICLPDRLDVSFLDVSGCVGMTAWPETGRVQIGRFSAQGCYQFAHLPPWINHIAQLDLRGCTSLTALPDGLHVTGWLDIGDTQITALPAGCQHAELRWNGVIIDEQIAFAPETLTAAQILGERNTERRRVMMERMGVERFVADAQPQILHEDTDPGGKRQLVRVEMDEDEPLIGLRVSCPSTGRQYLLRVPPTMTTCHQAAAWIAGFDDPDLYAPLLET